MAIQPIRNSADHDAALVHIEALWEAQPGTPEHDELEALSALICAYEDDRWPVLPSDPVDALKFHMEQNGFRQKDLAHVIGSVSRALEVLHRRRPLTVEMIRAIHAAWRVLLESLIEAMEHVAWTAANEKGPHMGAALSSVR
jgi:HTH-type transcriptional regulator/antitoxin HigA